MASTAFVLLTALVLPAWAAPAHAVGPEGFSGISVWAGPARTALDWRGPGGRPTADWHATDLAYGAEWTAATPLSPVWSAGIRGGAWLNQARIDEEEAGRRLQASVPWGGELRGALTRRLDAGTEVEISVGWGASRIEVKTERSDGSWVSSGAVNGGMVYGVAGQRMMDAGWALRAELVSIRPSHLTWSDGQRLTATVTQLRLGAVYRFP